VRVTGNADLRALFVLNVGNSNAAISYGEYFCIPLAPPVSRSMSFLYDPSFVHYSERLCRCSLGYYGKPPSECEECLPHGSCTTGTAMYWTAGYYPILGTVGDWNSLIGFQPCLGEEAEEICNPESNCFYTLEGLEECELCAPGYTGRLCSQCIVSDQECYVQAGDVCERVESPTRLALTLGITACIVGFLVLFLVRSTAVLFLVETSVVVLMMVAGLGESWLLQVVLILTLLHVLLRTTNAETFAGLAKSLLFLYELLLCLLQSLRD